MTSDAGEKRRILQRVAAGELSPGEAAALLEDRPPAPDVSRDQDSVSRIRVVGIFRTVEIDGDDSITAAVAEGPHRARRENGTMIFEDDPLDSDAGFSMVSPGRRGAIAIDLGSGRRRRVQIGEKPPRLQIRMNPNLPLEVEMAAGTVRVRGVHSPLRVSISAGSGRFEGVRSPVDINCEAGSLTLRGRIDEGRSEIRCTAGKVAVVLERGSSLQITARATLGKISLPSEKGGRTTRAGIGTMKGHATVGSGKGTMEIEATTGAVTVEVEE